jgi:hypothetical protein
MRETTWHTEVEIAYFCPLRNIDIFSGHCGNYIIFLTVGAIDSMLVLFL